MEYLFLLYGAGVCFFAGLFAAFNEDDPLDLPAWQAPFAIATGAACWPVIVGALIVKRHLAGKTS